MFAPGKVFTMANSLKVAAAMRRRLKEVGIKRSPALSLLYSTPSYSTGVSVLGTMSFMTSSRKASEPMRRRLKEVRLKR